MPAALAWDYRAVRGTGAWAHYRGWDAGLALSLLPLVGSAWMCARIKGQLRQAQVASREL